ELQHTIDALNLQTLCGADTLTLEHLIMPAIKKRITKKKKKTTPKKASQSIKSTSITTSIVPWLNVREGARPVEFYKSAFEAVELFRIGDANSVVARLSIDGAEFWISDESPEHANFSPESISGSTVRIILTVANPNAVFAGAINAGAKEVFPVTEEHGWL